MFILNELINFQAARLQQLQSSSTSSDDEGSSVEKFEDSVQEKALNSSENQESEQNSIDSQIFLRSPGPANQSDISRAVLLHMQQQCSRPSKIRAAEHKKMSIGHFIQIKNVIINAAMFQLLS